MADLEYSVADGIGTIRLNRPERKNAFTLDMVDRWAAVLGDARTDPEVRVLILTGTGDAFCSGVDLERRNEGRAATPLARKQVLSDQVHRIALAMEDLDKPVIAAINGTAVGAGLDMALMCDMRIMARTARASEGYIRVGLVPGDGGCYYLPRLVGVAKALELLLTGDFIDAPTAKALGLVNQVVPASGLRAASDALAVLVGIAEQNLIGPGALEVQVRRMLPGEANPPVHLDVLRGTEDVGVTAVRLSEGGRDGQLAVLAVCEHLPGQAHG